MFCGDLICEAEEVNNCCGEGLDCTVSVTCGDGVCSACENAGNCARDCGAATPTLFPRSTQAGERASSTPTSAPTATRPPTHTPRPTDAPTESPAGGSPPEPVIAPTAEPTAEPEADAETCETLEAAALSPALLEAAEESARKGDFFFFRSQAPPVEEQVWLACDEAPAGELCLPRHQAPAGDDEALRLAACDTTAECLVYRVSRATENEVCFGGDGPGERPGCEQGCLVYEEQRALAAAPVFAVSGGVIVLGVVGAGLISRRNRQAAEDQAESDLSSG